MKLTRHESGQDGVLKNEWWTCRFSYVFDAVLPCLIMTKSNCPDRIAMVALRLRRPAAQG